MAHDADDVHDVHTAADGAPAHRAAQDAAPLGRLLTATACVISA
ncbi:hypothetical protein ACQ4WX_08250 [Streptomyces lasalocidi]|nr:hypothetical protein [Streptomyces sp. MUSC 14]